MIPKCCFVCEHLKDWEHGSYGELIDWGEYCGVGLIFPTKKQACSRQKPNKVGA